MRIGIDARLFGPRVGGGGLGRYVEELVRHLETLDHENNYVIFLRHENWDDYVPAARNFQKVLAPWRWYTIGEQLGMPRVIREAKIDLLHVPHFNVPIFARVPFVVTIHDLILLEFPSIRASTLDPIRFWLKYIAYRFTLWFAVRYSRHIITVSNASRNALVKHFPGAALKTTAIPLGFTPQRPFVLTTPYSLPPTPYLIAVGNAFPHKNLDGLVQLFHGIIPAHPSLKLILTGSDDAFRATLREQVAKLGLNDRVLFTGFVNEEALDALYRNALGFVSASLLEGFSFPGLEAQERGVPVIASSIDTHREVFQDSACYFDPHDGSTFAAAIDHVTHDSALVETLRSRGRVNYQRFPWTRTATETLAIYRGAISSHGKEKTKTQNPEANPSQGPG